MAYAEVLRDLKWGYTHVHNLFLNEGEIAELTRRDIEEVKEKIALNWYGEAYTKGKDKEPVLYNIFDVVARERLLDKAERTALDLYISMGCHYKRRMAQKKRDYTFTKRKDGLLMTQVKLRNRRASVYGKNEEEVRFKAQKLEFEDQQEAFLEKIAKLTPLGLKDMEHELDSLAKDNREPGEGKENARRTTVPTHSEMFLIWVKFSRKEEAQKAQTLERYKTAYTRYIEGTVLAKTPLDQITNVLIRNTVEDIFNKYTLSNSEFGLMKRVLTVPIKHVLSLDEGEEYYDIPINVNMDRLSRRLHRFSKKVVTVKKDERTFSKNEIIEHCRIIEEHIVGKGKFKARYLLIKLNYQLGLRIGELSALRVQDIDFDNWVLYVNHGDTSSQDVDENEKPTGRRNYKLDDPKTPTSKRPIPLSEKAKAIIKEIMDFRERQGFSNLEKEGCSNDRLAYGGRELKGYKGIMSKAYIEVAGWLGYTTKEYHCHLAARKTFISRTVEAGGDEPAVASMAGHKDVAVTRKTYERSSKDMEAKRQIIDSCL